MTLDERTEALLTGFAPEDRLRLRPVSWASGFLGMSAASVYRLTSAGVLPHVKLPGGDRGARGRAGSVRFRLVDLVRFQVEREVAAVVTPEPVSTSRFQRDLAAVAGR